jgi:hypothetical protein
MSFFRRSVNEKADDSARSSSNDVYSSHEIVSTTGALKFVVEQGGNGSQPSYQEVSGAPVEAKSSLGYAVGPLTIVFINIGKMIGTGVYSTRTCLSRSSLAEFTDDNLAATVLKGTGSVGTSLIFWALGLLTSGTSLAVYLEYASYFPNRSGSEVVYLEQAFPRPKYFFPIAFAVQTVILSFSSGNAIGMCHNTIPEDTSLTAMVSHGSISVQDRRPHTHKLGKERRRHCLLYSGHVV